METPEQPKGRWECLSTYAEAPMIEHKLNDGWELLAIVYEAKYSNSYAYFKRWIPA